MKLQRIAIWVSLLILGIILGYVWYGFLFPDPFFVSKFTLLGKVTYLWLPRILIPILYFIIILLIVIKNRKTAQNIAIVIFTFFVLGIIAYPVLDILYYSESSSRNNSAIGRYHPYLQINPPLVQRLDSVSETGTVRIFCLGGSTTEFKDSKGIGWPDRLEKELRGIYKSDSIFVFNFGKAWYTTLHSLINYEVNLRKYKPDVIIIMHNINDFLHNADFSYLSKSGFRDDYGHFMGPSRNIFKNNGLFGKYLNYFKQTWYTKSRITFNQDSFPGLEPFSWNINTLIDLATLDNTTVILLTQPNILTENMDEQTKKICAMVNYEAVGKDKKWGYETAFIGMKQYNEKIKSISETRDVHFIDLEMYVQKSLKYFKDEVHYSDTTYNIISNILAKEIVRFKIVEK